MWDVGVHGVINLDSTPAGDATCLNKIDQWLDADGNQYHVTGNARTPGCDYFGYLTFSAYNLSNLFLYAHINTITPFFLKHKIGSGRIEYFCPERMLAKKMCHLVTAMVKRLGALQCQCAAATDNNSFRSVQSTQDFLVISDGSKRCHACQVQARAGKLSGTSAIGQ